MTKILGLVGTLLLLSSCSPQTQYRADHNTPNGWALGDTLRFTIEAPIAAPAAIYIHLRNDNSYPFANIFLRINRRENDSLVAADTLEYAMATPSGEWLGTGFLSVKESKLEWESAWEPQGDPPYTIEIAQAKRASHQRKGDDRLSGIVSVGVSVEYQNESWENEK